MSRWIVSFTIWWCGASCGTLVPVPPPHACCHQLSYSAPITRRHKQLANTQGTPALSSPAAPDQRMSSVVGGRLRCLLHFLSFWWFPGEAKGSLVAMGTWSSRQGSGCPHRHALVLVGGSRCMSTDDNNTSMISLTQFKLKLQVKAMEGRAALLASHSVSPGEPTMPRLGR